MSNFNTNPPYLPPQPATFKVRTNKIHWVGYPVVAAVGLIFGIIGGIGLASTPASTAASNSRPTVTTTVQPSVKPTTTPKKAAAEKPKSAAVTFAGNGTFLVGKDIKPGTYKSEAEGFLCYWERLRSLDGDLNAIIVNSTGQGSTIVRIKSTDKAFKTQGCSTWTLVK